MRTLLLAFVVLVLTLPLEAMAQEATEKPAADKAATDAAVQKGITWLVGQQQCISCHSDAHHATEQAARWLADKQCATCHFKVPGQPLAFDGKTGKLYEASFFDQIRTVVASSEKQSPACTRDSQKHQKTTYLGVSLIAIPPAVREHVKLPENMGLLVETVDAGSPAQAAGLKRHDVMLKFDEQWLVNSEQFLVLVRTYAPGTEVRLAAIQQNEPKTLVAKLAQREVPVSEERAARRSAVRFLREAQVDVNADREFDVLVARELVLAPGEAAEPAAPAKTITVAYLGVHTAAPSEALAKQLKLAAGLGLMIETVEENTAAAKAGLLPFDVLQKIDEQVLINPEQFTALIRSHNPGDTVRLALIREGKPQVVPATLGKREVEAPAEGSRRLLDTWLQEVSPSRQLDLKFSRAAARWHSAAEALKETESVKDADFVRRLYLDIMGVPPKPDEVKAFLSDASPQKRQRLIDELIARPEAIASSSGSTAIQWTDAEHLLSLISKDDSRLLTVKDAAGKTLFDGPVVTPEQRKALPSGVASKLDRLLESRALRESKGLSAQDLLERVLPQVDLAEVPLKQAFEKLRSQTGVNLVVNWKALKQAGINADEPITLSLSNVRLSTVLTTLLALAGDDKAHLGYTIEGEVILISVKGK